MHSLKLTWRVVIHLLWISVLLTSCNFDLSELAWVGVHTPQAPAALPTQAPVTATLPPARRMATEPAAATATPLAADHAGAGEPAGCLSPEAQAALNTPQKMLAYADGLLKLSRPLASRRLDLAWNAYNGQYLAGDGALAFAAGDLQQKYLLQRMLNALQVAGFVTWLRETRPNGLQILAIPLISAPDPASPWQPYIQAYWQSRQSLPEDRWVLPALKLPPCGWEIARGFAPRIGPDWWATMPAAWPDYPQAAAAYLADNTQAADLVAKRIHWLDAGAVEGPATMCGPLVWSLMHDAGALPPDRGGWSDGPRSFWLAKPSVNGRPWSLFPISDGHAYAFHEPLGSFDFNKFPLYPGDFFYTYSKRDGFDHMFLVTEVDASGNVYTVTNLVETVPAPKATIERVLLLNTHDPTVGIARNQWAHDRVHGRTGQDGFEIFRWAWMEKDITGQPAAYPVQPGDTVGLIAERWKTPAVQIARYNGIAVDTPLAIGDSLRIPPLETVGR